ncbi:MAG TPA: ABC transporter permease [Anaerolineaceae bacterium]|nr:ABC transporter permease [Anaerolineaceae bacterium]
MSKIGNVLNGFGKGFVKNFKLLARNKVGLFGLFVIVALVLICFVGPLIVPPETRSDTTAINKPPSAAHPLGTDFMGRENWIMFIHGGREVMIVAFLAGLFTTAIAVVVGAVSAFMGGKVDSTLMTITDIWLTLPRFLLLVVIATMIALEDAWTLALFLAVIGWPGLARQVRSQFLSLKKREYVEAAQLLDLGTPHIIFREMLPNMMSYIMIAMIQAMAAAIYSQTGLVFLGVVPFGNNWGVMFSLAYAKNAIYNPNAAASLLVPMGGIILLQLGLVLFSRSLEEVFNPRLRMGV